MAISSRMIFSLALVFVTSIAGSYCMTVDCYQKIEATCPFIQTKFPDTPEELEKACQPLIDEGKCILTVYHECAKNESYWDTEEDAIEFQRRLEFIEEKCNKNSLLFQEIANNLECISDTIRAKDLEEVCSFRAVEREDIIKLNNAVNTVYVGCIKLVIYTSTNLPVLIIFCDISRESENEPRFFNQTAAASGSYCMSFDCYQWVQATCPNIQTKFPDTEEELEKACQSLIDHGKCILTIFPECAKNESYWDTEEDLIDFQRRMEFIEEKCNTNSLLFQEISNNLECISDTIRAKDIQEMCSFGAVESEDMKKIYEAVNPTYLGCVGDVWKVSCVNAVFDVECGSETRNAISAITPTAFYYSNLEQCDHVKSKLSSLEGTFKSILADGRDITKSVPEILEAIKKDTFFFSL